MALLSLPAPSSSHWGVCSETPDCKNGVWVWVWGCVCVYVCVCRNAQVHAFRRCSSPRCSPGISTQCKQSFRNRLWNGGCVQNWPNLVFSLASLSVKNWGRGSFLFPSADQTWTREMRETCVLSLPESLCTQKWGRTAGNEASCDFNHFFYPPMFSPVALVWPLPGCRSSQHL